MDNLVLLIIVNEFLPAFSDHEKIYSYYFDLRSNQDLDTARRTCANNGYTLIFRIIWDHM